MSLPLTDGTDAELAALAVAGRQDAYRELLARHRESVFRLIRATTGDPTEALDLTQVTFVAAFAAIARYDPERPFSAWVKRIALNKCRDWARRRKVRAFFTRAAPLDDALQVAATTASPETETADRAELTQVVRAIGLLPHKLREVLVLCAIEGMSQAEAADALSVSEKTVETRLYRARNALRQQESGTVREAQR